MTNSLERDARPLRIGGASFGSDEVIDAVDPATGSVISSFHAAGPDDVDRAVSVASEAFAGWRRTEPRERAAALEALAGQVLEHAEELALLDVLDNGSPLREMRGDAAMGAAQMRYFAAMILQLRGDTVPTSFGRLNYTLRQPYGVVARIIPFNHPLMFAAAKMAAPIAAGNAVIIKPSEHTTLSALRLAELAEGILPPGVLTVLPGYGATTGDALVRHPEIRRIAFIGSAETGRAILSSAASVSIKTVTLELGGKNPLVIFPDADLDLALEAAARGMNFTWQGQSCGSTSRLMVHRSVYPDFVERLGTNLSAMRQGSPSDESTETGAIVNLGQYDKVADYLTIGKDEGARVVTGGAPLTDGAFADGLFVPPTLFADVDPDSRLAQEEIFGPVLAAMPFDDYDEALRIANNVRYGLTASVFTRDLATAHSFARDVEAGYVWINEVARHVPGTAFGGVKDSGLGREEDIEELVSYTQPKNVHVNFGG